MVRKYAALFGCSFHVKNCSSTVIHFSAIPLMYCFKFDSALISIGVTNINDNAPVIVDDSASISEAATVSTPVYNVNDANTATDFDLDGDAITYSITAGNTGNAFAINAGTGVISVNAALDYETLAAYTLTVSATDGSNVDSALIHMYLSIVYNRSAHYNRSATNVYISVCELYQN